MIHYALACILWAKPNVQLKEIPVDNNEMASLQVDFNSFIFEASVVEERMNAVKIIMKKNLFSAEAYSALDVQLRSLATKITLGDDEASLDCEIKNITKGP